MDMETVLPRTCQTCYGVGYVYFGNKEDYEVTVCDECKGKRKA